MHIWSDDYTQISCIAHLPKNCVVIVYLTYGRSLAFEHSTNSVQRDQ